MLSLAWLVRRSGTAGLASRLEATLAAERVASAEKLAPVDEARLRPQDAFKTLVRLAEVSVGFHERSWRRHAAWRASSGW